VILSQYLAPSRPGNGSTAIHSAVTKHGKLITLVAGKWQGLLLRGDDEVFVTRISTLHHGTQW